jgi:hypothetical protein
LKSNIFASVFARSTARYLTFSLERGHCAIRPEVSNNSLSNFKDDHKHPHNVKDAEISLEQKELGKTGVTEWLFADESGQIA